MRLRTGDKDLFLVADAGLGNEVRSNQVAVPTGKEDPMRIGPMGALTGNGEPPVPVHPMGRCPGGSNGGEDLAGQPWAVGSGNM